MKGIQLAVIFTFGTIASAQQPGIPSTTSAPGAYSPHPNPSGMDMPAPADRPPQDVLMEDAKLVGKLQKLLPNSTSPQQFCDGFKTLGECVAAIHAAQNLEIPLANLKAKVTGKSRAKLENAIHELKPDVDPKAERKKAQKQADRDIPASN